MTDDRAIVNYGSRDLVKELGERLRKMMPGTASLTENEALTVAQIAIAHDLDPFNGEVWGIKGDDKWYGVMVGIKGLRKSANREAGRLNFSYWTEFIQVDPSEVGASKEAIVYKCIIRDTQAMQAYGKSINILTTSGIPYTQALEMVGKAPMTVGIGIATPGERSKMAIHPRARKRAEADALKQRFDLQFQGAMVDVQGTVEEAIEGNVIDIIPEEHRDREPQKIMAELGYDNPAPAPEPNGKHPVDDATAKAEEWLVNSKYAENIFAAQAIVKLWGKPLDTPAWKRDFQTWVTLYRDWRNAGTESKAAAENAHAGARLEG